MKLKVSLSKTYSSKELLGAPNAASVISEEDLDRIGHAAVQEFEIDKSSRESWETKYLDACKLALQIWERKTTPWEGASNIKFPLLTIASLQFQARAYPALVTRPELVHAAPVGDDPDGTKGDEADRVSKFMSYQLLVQDPVWEEDTDRLLFMLPIVGFIIRKTYYDPIKSVNRSDVILPEDFVVSYFTKTIETSPRHTVILHYSDRILDEKMGQGAYLKIDLTAPAKFEQKMDEIKRARGFVIPVGDPDADRDVLEQYTFLDLDGDGYAEPIIVTVDRATCKVLRLVLDYVPEDIVYTTTSQIKKLVNQAQNIQATPPQSQDPTVVTQELQAKEQMLAEIERQIDGLRKNQKILHIDRIEYFTKYPFIPAPDGSFYDIGFGHILSPINNAVDTLINQLIDAGTLQNSNVGFISSSARLRGADFRFRPFEYKRADVPLGSLHEAILPLPINAPSPVLYQLLELMIQYGERTASISDMMVGDTPGQNTPAETSRNALQQGLKVYTGIQLRLYRAFTSEYRKLYKLNRIYLDAQQYFKVLGTTNMAAVYQTDFLEDPSRITPDADPSMGSRAERLQRANAVLGIAKNFPGFNLPYIMKWVLKEMEVPAINEIYNGQPAPTPPEIQLKAADVHRKTIEGQAKMHAHLVDTLGKIKLQEAQATLALAQAQHLGDQLAIQTAEAQLNQFSEIHNAMMDLQRVINESASTQSDIAAAQAQSQAGGPPASEGASA